jgi:cytochrome P450
MTDDDLRDELLTLLLAGHETTAIALAWSLYWLHRNPESLARVHAELDSVARDASAEAFVQLPYLDAVCSETLRLHPIVPDIARRLRRPFEFMGYSLPAGVSIGVGITALHTHRATYPDAERFRPERFLERKFSPFEWAPFGGGARRCLGAAFAQFEMKIVLGTLLGAYRFRLDEADEVRPARRSITMGPSTGVQLVYEGVRARSSMIRGDESHVASATV